MAINTSLIQIIKSELINRGYREDYKEGQLRFYDDDYSFINRILTYTEEVEEIVNDVIFRGFKLEDDSSDKQFKRHFINRFFNHRLAYQTLEAFSGQVINIFLNNKDFLDEYYSYIDDYSRGKSESTSSAGDLTRSDTRTAIASLPQSEVNIDVDNTTLDYANENTITRDETGTESDDRGEQFQYNIDTLLKSRNILNEVFNDFERNCFLKVW